MVVNQADGAEVLAVSQRLDALIHRLMQHQKPKGQHKPCR
ncbi:MAG TPA: hypothetical protein VIL95_03360 [Bacillota bacterium]